MSCKTILPTNLDDKINALDLVGCKRLSNIKKVIRKIENFNNALKIDEEFLDLLKDEWGVDFWDEISEIEKRKLIEKSKFYYKKIGTVWAIKEVLKIFEIDTKLKEWFEYDGNPYYFKIVLTPTTTAYKFDEKMLKRIVSLIDNVKNVRSVLEGFEFELVLEEEIKIFSGFNFKPKIAKDFVVDLEPVENLSCIQGAISNVSINSTLNLNLTSLNNNTIQGVVIWRV